VGTFDPDRPDSNRPWRALVEHGNDGIVLIGADGTMPYASPALLRALGYSAGEIVGRVALELVHPDDRNTAHRAGRGAPPGATTDVELRLLARDGAWRCFSGTATNLLDDADVRAVVFNARDISDRKLAEERLAFQAQVLAQINEPVVASDVRARITYWNAAAARLFGWTEAEALGQDGEKLLQTRWPEGKDSMVHALVTMRQWQGEMVHTTRAGEEVIVHASIRILMNDEGKPTGGISVIQDVTARKNMEEQLRQSQKMEAIGLLAGGVAHDFNNVLAVILGFTELAERKLPADHVAREPLAEVAAAAKRGSDLTRKLLAFSRKQILQPRPLDLGAAVDEFSSMLERILGEDVELVVDRAAETLVVRADGVHLQQVLLNLCTNARQAMPEGGLLTLTTRRTGFDEAAVRRNPWARVGTFAEIEVSDTGVGMDARTRARAFEPFFTTKATGTGLGLATVYGIVEQHGGFVHLESETGRGTRLRVYLPLAQSVRPAAPTQPPPAHGELQSPPSSELRGSETILVAEDEPAIRSLVALTLTDLGYRVIATSDGEEAVRAYEQHASEIALVVLDVVMPRMGAPEAYARMQAIRPDVRVLFATGYAPEATQLAELIERTRVPIIEKPFSSRALAEKVRSAIGPRES
jgi:PAS domain S-box-containing protein